MKKSIIVMSSNREMEAATKKTLQALTDGGASMSYVYCTPNSALVAQGLTQEVLDTDGKVIAYVNPAPPSGAISRLDRCSLDLVNSGGVTGNYAVQNGCIQREGYVTNAQAPYWDELNTASHTPVKMCAIEAQANDVNPWTGASCETRLTSDRTCGCGVAARRCDCHAIGHAELARERLDFGQVGFAPGLTRTQHQQPGRRLRAQLRQRAQRIVVALEARAARCEQQQRPAGELRELGVEARTPFGRR